MVNAISFEIEPCRGVTLLDARGIARVGRYVGRLKRIIPPLQGLGISLGPVSPGLQPGLCYFAPSGLEGANRTYEKAVPGTYKAGAAKKQFHAKAQSHKEAQR